MAFESKPSPDYPSSPKVIGSYVQAFLICPRQVWLMSRQICPDEDHELLQIGRLIQSQSYARERKEVHIEHLALDLVRRAGKNFVVAEVKKSSRAAEAARMQLAFYLYELKQMGLEAEGELLFPEERRKEYLVLTPELEAKIVKMKEDIVQIIARPIPPAPARTRFCGKCAYAEFCWA
ncbi:CRISPR-associated protein Cas4 [Ammonifex degensii KC4]|uniref:CRISPR-associated exonuclease Cas4 n=1 Tax=Ammonifex degensii (strain DSM 10501 / KC4) TaxID=429009 RepID=C9RCY4_AMMDK|nr:CRISPR-associated protein Cas4 [Ammonifex degensii]ACX52111.1 CRISPR-associated protein Cas4 [Ammonifex degensii KC4]